MCAYSHILERELLELSTILKENFAQKYSFLKFIKILDQNRQINQSYTLR